MGWGAAATAAGCFLSFVFADARPHRSLFTTVSLHSGHGLNFSWLPSLYPLLSGAVQLKVTGFLAAGFTSEVFSVISIFEGFMRSRCFASCPKLKWASYVTVQCVFKLVYSQQVWRTLEALWASFCFVKTRLSNSHQPWKQPWPVWPGWVLNRTVL